MFIKRLEFQADNSKISLDVDKILNYTEWGVDNQIGLTHRINHIPDKWKDCVGSLKERNRCPAEEHEFTVINDQLPEYLKSVLFDFAEFQGFKLGRVRLMRLQSKCGLSVHSDTSVRYHYVIDTNEFSYISHILPTDNPRALSYHLPKDGYFYRVDTRLSHFVYNGGKTDRIHMVIVPI